MTAIDHAISLDASRAAAAPATRCTHCMLPVPAGLIEPAQSRQFCCTGCRTAYRLINDGGLGRFYDMARDQPGATRPDAALADAYAHFDDPAFQRLYITPATGGLTATLRVEGIHCAACVWLLERLQRVAPEGAVRETRVDLRRKLLHITWNPAAAPLSEIARACAALGYPLHAPRGLSISQARAKESRSQLIRVGVAGAIMANVMLVTLALFAGDADTMDAGMQSFFRRLSMAMSVVSLAWPGSVFFRGAWAAVRTQTPSMDVPIAVGLALGAAWGTVNALRGEGSIYFDTLTTLVFLLLLGRWIQFTQQHRAASAVELLFSLTPATARLVENDTVREVPIESLTATGPGAIVEVIAGGTVPVDGTILSGDSELDTALLTGESRPVRVSVGDTVAAGAVNLVAPIRVQVEAAGESTRVAQLMRLVEDASEHRAPIIRLADRITVVFVPVVLTLAIATAVIWAFIRPSVAIDNAAALLITTCPCALGLATPLAVIVAIGRAARRGILIKGGDTLEALARPRRGIILLDKTGTITRGGISVTRCNADAETLRLAGALESAVTHPIATAIAAAASAAGGALPPATDVRHTLGRGISGTVEGRRVAIGSPRYISEISPLFPPDVADSLQQYAAEGLTPVVIAINGEARGALGLGDLVRHDAADSVRALRVSGWDVRLLSGDDPAIAALIGAQVGIDPANCRGGASPEDKLEEVRRLASEDPGRTVVMVGDGVNDAAALSAATVGIAVHGSAEASLAAAGVFLSRPGLAPLVELTSGAGRTLRLIRRNIATSLLYNSLFITLAMTGVLTPLIAAVVMPFSSLSVVLLSTRSRTFGGSKWK